MDFEKIKVLDDLAEEQGIQTFRKIPISYGVKEDYSFRRDESIIPYVLGGVVGPTIIIGALEICYQLEQFF